MILCANSRTLVFADRRGTFKGSQTLEKHQKSAKIDEKSIWRCFANKPCDKNRFTRSRTRLGLDFGRLSALPDAPGNSFWCSGASLESLRARPGRAGESRDRPEVAAGTLVVTSGHPERVSGPILSRFRVPRSFYRDRFCIDESSPGVQKCRRFSFLEGPQSRPEFIMESPCRRVPRWRRPYQSFPRWSSVPACMGREDHTKNSHDGQVSL